MQSFALFDDCKRDECRWARSAEEVGCSEGSRNVDADEEHDRREELEHVLLVDGVKAAEHDTRYAKSRQMTGHFPPLINEPQRSVQEEVGWWDEIGRAHV